MLDPFFLGSFRYAFGVLLFIAILWAAEGRQDRSRTNYSEIVVIDVLFSDALRNHLAGSKLCLSGFPMRTSKSLGLPSLFEGNCSRPRRSAS